MQLAFLNASAAGFCDAERACGGEEPPQAERSKVPVIAAISDAARRWMALGIGGRLLGKPV
jgi:hypothetical protein